MLKILKRNTLNWTHRNYDPSSESYSLYFAAAKMFETIMINAATACKKAYYSDDEFERYLSEKFRTEVNKLKKEYCLENGMYIHIFFEASFIM